MDRWTNRVALVTGAGSGIGASISESLVKHGMTVVGCARNVEPIDALTKQCKKDGHKGKLISCKCDISKESEVVEMFTWIEKTVGGGVDVLVNNAGRSSLTSLLEVSVEEMRAMLDLNVVASVHCAQLAVKSMLNRGVNDGHIFNINSMLGHNVLGVMNFYSATKFAITALTQGLRKELAAQNSRIKVTAISPGRTETNFHFTVMGERAKTFYANMENLTPKDVSDALVYALSTSEGVQVYDVQLQVTNVGDPNSYKS